MSVDTLPQLLAQASVDGSTPVPLQVLQDLARRADCKAEIERMRTDMREELAELRDELLEELDTRFENQAQAIAMKVLEVRGERTRYHRRALAAAAAAFRDGVGATLRCIEGVSRAMVNDPWVRRGVIAAVLLAIGGALFMTFDLSIGNGWFTASGSN